MDLMSKQDRSALMSRIRSKDTSPEMDVRRALHALGYRYRIHVSELPGRPDLVLPKYRTAIQVRGCFWHGHGCRLDHRPKSNVRYWGPKLRANRRRDISNDRKLRRLGWSLLVVWECNCRNRQAFEREIARISRLLERKKHSYAQ